MKTPVFIYRILVGLIAMPLISERKSGSTTSDVPSRNVVEGDTKTGFETTQTETIIISDDLESSTASQSISVKPIDINESTTN